jgi:hypothetical protein
MSRPRSCVTNVSVGLTRRSRPSSSTAPLRRGPGGRRALKVVSGLLARARTKARASPGPRDGRTRRASQTRATALCPALPGKALRTVDEPNGGPSARSPPERPSCSQCRDRGIPFVGHPNEARSGTALLVQRPGHSLRQRSRRGGVGLQFPRGRVDDTPPRLDALRVRRLDRFAEARHHESRARSRA